MPFLPKNFAHKKYAKGRIPQRRTQKQAIQFGMAAIRALQPGRLTDRQLEATRKAIKKVIKPLGGVLRRRIGLRTPVTQKSVASRMGRGKGRVSFHVAPVAEGQTLFEVYDPAFHLHRETLRKILMKLPIRTAFEVRRDLGQA